MIKCPSEGDPHTYAVIGTAMEVHRQLGPGFLESVYREAMLQELTVRGIAFEAEVSLPVFFKECRLYSSFRADLICFGNILVELKAMHSTGRAETAQVVNYLRASRLSKGLLLNFGAPSLQFSRILL
jgi:GxxExxY protein